MSTSISFVLATKNRSAMVRDCLASFPAVDPTRVGIELIVVDDASTDDTAQVVADFAASVSYPVRRVLNDGNRQNAGRNTGVRKSSGDLIVFIDDDEKLIANYVTRLEHLHNDHPDIDCFGGPYLELPGKQLRTCSRCSLSAKAVAPGEDGRYTGLLGGNMAIRRRAFDEVGNFDETLSGLGNESEWFDRAQTHGITILYDQRLSVWHRRDYESLWSLSRKAYREGRVYYLYLERTGQPVRARPKLIPRFAAHAVRHACANGVFLAAREIGRTLGAIKSYRRRIR